MTVALELKDIGYGYRAGSVSKTVFRGVNLKFEQGKLYAITGPSGAGKTTLLSLLAGLDSPSHGNVEFYGKNLQDVGLAAYRRSHAATIFQDLNLLDYLTPLENVTAGMELSGTAAPNRRFRAEEILTHLGISEEDQKRQTTQLSGGQQQRVAVARALASEVNVLLADEPTGSLDEANTLIVMDELRAIAHERGCCVIVVTHSPAVARSCDVALKLQRGKITHG